jgi:uncharacterized membrane protein (UPF0127 family)
LAHWLSALVRDPATARVLWLRGADRPLATRVHPAFDSASRRRGLLGRTRLDDDEALILAPCSSVHTAFMRFPLDLVFADRAGRVLKTCSGVRPWRIRLAVGSFAVVELPEGALARTGCGQGAQLELRTIV